MRRSPLIPCSASVNAATIVVGASGFAAVSRLGSPIRKPTPRLSSRNSSWQAFSTTRTMLPDNTDSSIASVSTSVSFRASTAEKSALASPFPLDALVDELAQVAFEVGHQVGALAGQRLARIEKNRLILAHVRALGARHQQVADAVEHRRERQQQTMDREIPAIAEYPGHVSGHRAPGGPVAGGRCHAHAFGPRWPCTGSQLTSGRPVASQR